MSGFLDGLIAKIPGVSSAMQQVDSIRAHFLAIPQTTNANKSILAFARSKTNDAAEVDQLNKLMTAASAVDSGFQNVLGQFGTFDSLKASGASAVDLATAASSLVVGAQSVQRQSDALTANVAPFAKKYGLPAPSQSTAAAIPATLILVGAGALMLFVLSRQKRNRKRGR